MIVGAVVRDQVAAAEHLYEALERGPGVSGLGDRELVLDLPADSTPGVAHHRDREAPFAVDEADGPLFGTWPFLLIVRTGRVVTAHRHTLRRGCDIGRVPPG